MEAKMKNMFRPVSFCLIVLLIGVACQFSASYGVTPTASPPQIEATSTSAAAKPTSTSAPTEEPAAFKLDAKLYTHNKNTFSMYPPAGWKIDDTDPGGTVTWFTSPDEKASIAVTVINTGYELDAQSFSNYVDAREYFFFERRFDLVKSINKKVNEADALVEKTFSINNVPQRSQTKYIKEGQAIYSVDYFSDADVADVYFKAFPKVAEKFTTNPSGVSNLDLYNSFFTFKDQNNLYTIKVPAWTYDYKTGQDIYIDSFSSPDGNAAIQTIVFDVKKNVTQSLAGQVALILLNQFYTTGAGDIKISKDTPQPDGRERLDWRSKKSNLEGVTVFESRGHDLILFSVFYGSQVKDVFTNSLNIVLDSYQPATN
jgi:hypothetical protein